MVIMTSTGTMGNAHWSCMVEALLAIRCYPIINVFVAFASSHDSITLTVLTFGDLIDTRIIENDAATQGIKATNK
jgi:hypothetical protein